MEQNTTFIYGINMTEYLTREERIAALEVALMDRDVDQGFVIYGKKGRVYFPFKVIDGMLSMGMKYAVFELLSYS